MVCIVSRPASTPSCESLLFDQSSSDASVSYCTSAEQDGVSGSWFQAMMGAQYIVNLAGHCWPQSAYYNMPTLSSAGGTAITCRQVCCLSIDRCQPKSALRQDWPVSLPRHTFAKFSLHVDHSGTSSRIFNETAKTGLISLQIVLHPGPAVVVVTKASRTAFAS